MFRWLRSLFTVSSETARRRIAAGQGRPGMRVAGSLNLARLESVRELPRNLHVDTLDVSRCPHLRSLPRGLHCRRLTLRGLAVQRLPPDLAVTDSLEAQGCQQLRELPWGLTVHSLDLRECTALRQLPDSLRVHRLNVSGCTGLEALPARLGARLTHLATRDCTALASLPETYLRLVDLDVSGCARITELPEGIQVRSWIDVAGSGLTGIPGSMRSTRVLWRGVPVSDRVAFDPAAITAEEVLNEPNQAIRGILVERVGLERFVTEARAEVLDCDNDAGGERRLLRVRFDGGEDVMCVAVHCPSTGHQYVLRVPPEMVTCREAIAWTAGFTNPEEYLPVRET